jgi:beta-glucuronidase
VLGALAGAAAVALSGAPVAAAQGPVYTAQPPTKQVLYQDGQTDRWLLGGTWLYRQDLSNVGVADGWFQNVASTDGWTPASVPNSYNTGDLSNLSWSGYVGWYRKDFTLPAKAFPGYVPAAFRHWIVRFESVNYYATVWLNGKKLGTHAGAYLPFEFDLKGLRPGVNRLIVRVDNRTNPGSLPPGPGSSWWNFGGLQGEVYLRSVARADIERAQIRPLLPCPSCAATIADQAVIRNVTNSRQKVRLYGTYGGFRLKFGTATIAPHSTWTANASVRIPHPKLWSITSPTLYKATLSLTDQRGRPLGGYLDYSGIRSITVKAGQLLLNGRALHLRGVDLQEQFPSTGAALTPAQYGQYITWAQELGAHLLRVHYPVAPELEEMADRAGILIWSDIQVWGVQNQYLSQPGWLAQAHALLRADIYANQNHPSIMLWSIANELPFPATGAEASYVKGATALAQKLDPTRPVGMAVDNWPGVACQSAYSPLQVLGDNEYFGWFDLGSGTTADRDALSPWLDSYRACYPHKALFITEFGFDANRNGPVEERGTYQFQSNSVAFHLGVFATKPWLSGVAYQTLQDYAAYPGYNGGNPWPNTPWNQKGLVDQYGNVKPAFSVVSQIYHATAQVAP